MTKTLYDHIGPERLEKLVNRFYDLVLNGSKIEHLFDKENTLIREKQYKFLTQFLGGPQLYSLEYGHPRMKARHLPHPIGPEERDEWLRCMKQAIDEMDFDEPLKMALYNCFPPVANHMMNR